MIITLNWLKDKDACIDGVNWFKKQKLSDGIEVLKSLIDQDRLDWANWLIVRVMGRKQYLQYAIFAAEQVISIYEKKFPQNDRPRKAIEAAKKCLAEDNKENRAAAAAAAFFADAAAAAFSAAAFSADAAAAFSAAAFSAAADAAFSAAANAAFSAAFSADAAFSSAAAAAFYAAADAASAAAFSSAAARKKMKLKILGYGLSLLKELDA